MNLTSATQVKELLAKHGLHPKKRFGQNFLIDRNVLERLLDAAGIGQDSLALEIGAGLGVVSVELAARARKVVCVEVDHQLEAVLREVLQNAQNVEVVIEDFLKLDVCGFLGSRGNGKWIAVANLPYYITTPILTKLIDSKECFSSILLMVQREVAARLRSQPGVPDYGAITVFAQYHCEIRSVIKASRNVFYPVPDVDSEIIKLTVRDTPAVAVADEKLFFGIVKAAFGKRRKTLLNSLSSSGELGWDKAMTESVLASARIDPRRRGETLSLEEFAALANTASV